LAALVLIALTGTPGTGKSSVAALLERRGYATVDLTAYAREHGFVVGRDEARATDEVDVEALGRSLRVEAKMGFLVGHFAHRLPANAVIVLRCRPSVLRRRLEARGWPPVKVRENVEAEAIDLITQEAARRSRRVYEVDTTERTEEQTEAEILGILMGDTAGHEPGGIDWSAEVMSWY
jgi:adenylate kinase